MGSISFCSVLLIVGMAGAAAAEDAATDVPSHATTRSPTAAGTPSHQSGNASFYSHRLRGRRTASGQPYDPDALTAAHRTLPLGTRLEVVNPKNDRRVVVTVNDRGPVQKNRVLDVSSAAADALDMKKSGVTHVHTRVVRKDEAPAAETIRAPIADEATSSVGPSTSATSPDSGVRR